jgi:pyridoxamine 5'-phosphate oxidase
MTHKSIDSASGIFALLSEIPKREPPVFGAMGSVDRLGRARVRYVVLRDVDASAATITVTTDARSAKIADVQQQPVGEITFWLPDIRVQLRLLCRWKIIKSDSRNPTEIAMRMAAWTRLSPATQKTFFQPTPGKKCGSTNRQRPLTPVDLSEPPASFAALIGTVGAIDALDLSTNPHTRIQYRRTHRRWSSQRINP